MAEIKSTMEMVLERAARMEQEATSATSVDKSREGMRLAASYMNDATIDLVQLLAEQKDDEQPSIQNGMIQTLLRNVLLPRDEALQETSKQAIAGLLAISSGKDDVATICAELQQILEQYGQHKDQTTEQLETALINQMQQQAEQTGQVDNQQMDPTAHPQYATELSKMLGDLNDQYNQAIDQRKSMIQQILATQE